MKCLWQRAWVTEGKQKCREFSCGQACLQNTCVHMFDKYTMHPRKAGSLEFEASKSFIFENNGFYRNLKLTHRTPEKKHQHSITKLILKEYQVVSVSASRLNAGNYIADHILIREVRNSCVAFNSLQRNIKHFELFRSLCNRKVVNRVHWRS